MCFVDVKEYINLPSIDALCVCFDVKEYINKPSIDALCAVLM